jgi:hypothetical protein
MDSSDAVSVDIIISSFPFRRRSMSAQTEQYPLQSELHLTERDTPSFGRTSCCDRFCYAHARDTQLQFIFYSICPIAAPEDKRSAIAHFLTLAHYGLLIGNFELDFNDGEIRYKTSIDVEGDRLSHALIKRLVYTNVTMMDEYIPGIKAVIEKGISPEEAIGAIEQVSTNTPVEG